MRGFCYIPCIWQLETFIRTKTVGYLLTVCYVRHVLILTTSCFYIYHSLLHCMLPYLSEMIAGVKVNSYYLQLRVCILSSPCHSRYTYDEVANHYSFSPTELSGYIVRGYSGHQTPLMFCVKRLCSQFWQNLNQCITLQICLWLI